MQHNSKPTWCHYTFNIKGNHTVMKMEAQKTLIPFCIYVQFAPQSWIILFLL